MIPERWLFRVDFKVDFNLYSLSLISSTFSIQFILYLINVHNGEYLEIPHLEKWKFLEGKHTRRLIMHWFLKIFDCCVFFMGLLRYKLHILIVQLDEKFFTTYACETITTIKSVNKPMSPKYIPFPTTGRWTAVTLAWFVLATVLSKRHLFWVCVGLGFFHSAYIFWDLFRVLHVSTVAPFDWGVLAFHCKHTSQCVYPFTS